jgi:hypothetical protein
MGNGAGRRRTIIEGLFHASANLVEIEAHLKEIRYLLGEEPDEEEEETNP